MTINHYSDNILLLRIISNKIPCYRIACRKCGDVIEIRLRHDSELFDVRACIQINEIEAHGLSPGDDSRLSIHIASIAKFTTRVL